MVYHFKSMKVVPTSKDFIDITLSKTQRKTPTVVHQGYKISRIRRFYMNKIKFTQESYTERLTEILSDFPRLDDIHPFYNDLINVLYSRDHYKIALGQLSTAKNLISNVGNDYLAMIKYGDSLYRCKELKRAALGRMTTIVKKCNTALSYLEQVRQHLSRLPTIDPTTRTLLITGYPNTGKSSYIGKISNANPEVQPYAFTTKSLYVGHFEYYTTQWQCIDTPGILDHSLEERNTIEMQSITALAHLNATILYFIDISEECGYPLSQQVSLFHHIRALFKNKPLLIIANKSDKKKISDLSREDRELVEGMKKIRGDDDTQIIEMSNYSNENIDKVKNTACDMLLTRRVDKKEKSNKFNEILPQITITRPEKRDDKERPLSIPESVKREQEERKRMIDELAALAPTSSSSALSSSSSSSSSMSDDLSLKPKKKTAREIELEMGGPGIFQYDQRKHYVLANPEWKYDIQPEIMDGRNVADFFDGDVLEHLNRLEEEEEELMREWKERISIEEENGDSELDEEEEKMVKEIRDNKKILMADNQQRKTNNKPVIPRPLRPKNIVAAETTIGEMGLPTAKMVETLRSRSRERGFLKRGRVGKGRGREGDEDEDGDHEMRDGDNDNDNDVNMDIDDGKSSRGRSRSRPSSSSSSSTQRDPSLPRPNESVLTHKLRMRSRSKTRAESVPRQASPSPFRNVKQKMAAQRIAHEVQKPRNQDARMGEGDRHHYDEKPKHLYSGKRTIGKTDRR